VETTVKIRPAVSSDTAFIFKSWLMGQYHGNRPAKGVKQDPRYPIDYLGSIDQDTFMKEYHSFIELQLSRKGVNIQVACLSTDPDVVLGYSVSCGSTLIWVHVKPDWRNIGIGRDLIPKDIKEVSNLTRTGDAIRRKHNWAFNPWS